MTKMSNLNCKFSKILLLFCVFSIPFDTYQCLLAISAIKNRPVTSFVFSRVIKLVCTQVALSCFTPAHLSYHDYLTNLSVGCFCCEWCSFELRLYLRFKLKIRKEFQFRFCFCFEDLKEKNLIFKPLQFGLVFMQVDHNS